MEDYINLHTFIKMYLTGEESYVIIAFVNGNKSTVTRKYENLMLDQLFVR